MLLKMKAIILMASFVFISCEKSSGSLGLDLVSGDQTALGVKRSIPIVLHSEFGDSINSTQPQYFMAGHLQDPVFGEATNNFSVQYGLSQTSPNFGTNAVCDSAKWVLNYQGNYSGDTNSNITLRVHELGEKLEDTSYYSNHVFSLGMELGSKTMMPRPFSTTSFEDSSIVPSLIMDVDPTWVYNKIIEPANAGNPAFDNNEDFVDYFYGFHLNADATGNCVPSFDLNGSSSFFRIYYREDPSDTVSKSFDLVTALSLSSSNQVEFDYSSAEFDLNNQDTTNGEYKLYVQSMGGVTTRIDLSALETYRDSSFIINKAELVLPVITGSDAGWEPPSNLLLLEERNDVRVFVLDIGEPVGHYGGELEYDFFRNGSYTFNISRQIHKYLNTDSFINDIVIIPSSSATKMNRVVLGGNVNPVQTAEFIIYFTRTK